MTKDSSPEGMIAAVEYARSSGESLVSVTEKLIDGLYIGREVDGEWYMEKPLVKQVHVSQAEGNQNNVTEPNVPTSYGTAKTLSKTTVFLGWLIVIASVIYFMGGVFDSGYGGRIQMFYGLVGFLSGLGIVQASQVVLAVVDTADNTRALLKFMREK